MAKTFTRESGISRPLVKIVKHDGALRAAILIDVKDLEVLRAVRRAAELELVTKTARTDPEFAKLAREAGLTIKRAHREPRGTTRYSTNGGTIGTTGTETGTTGTARPAAARLAAARRPGPSVSPSRRSRGRSSARASRDRSR